jgi:tartrate dehydrogenase/decarboxylase/D-malate dehydrogenase
MFEPIHGSAPDIAGKGLANPLATIWSAAQMLEFLGHGQWSDKVLGVIARMLKEKIALTPDMGGKTTTAECGSAAAKLLG